jgi:glyoxylase-like metal-dependent hydrolase (beta-lactamase superfamily II)
MQAPSSVGRVEISVVCEGYAPLDLADELPNTDWAVERERYPWCFHDERSWAWHVHAFALHTAAGLVMVDTGASPMPPIQPWAEHTALEDALAAAGVDPAEVRMVVHTHVHADHAGGAVVRGEPRFPNAIHVAHPADWAHFGSGGSSPYNARRPMQRLLELDMLDLRADDREVWPGVRVVHAPGHTPGHRVVVLEDGDDAMLFTGDLLHVPVQIARPHEPGNHDLDADEAAGSRAELVRRARDGAWRVAVSHFGRPFGRVGSSGWEDDLGPDD